MPDNNTTPGPGGAGLRSFSQHQVAAPINAIKTESTGTRQYEMKDSGHRREFESGAKRDRAEGKGRFDLLSPMAIKRMADVMEKGAAKYAARNYEKGMPLSNFVDSAMRHLFQFLEGHRDEDHIAQAAVNCMMLMQIQVSIERGILPKDLDDLPDYTNKIL